MERALNRECVKSITCRDDSKWINENCFNSRQVATVGPCCAIKSSDVH